ncbi:MAG: tryptophan--tRNA ligase [Clostridia bacterium]|nr:tryptophan--tRNA ligase [Clostridia bacterium]MBQ6883421.1 tryptophan--tRNA ligase [Clostridia bacterium]
MERKVMFSAVQPSGIPTIGNYVGAIKNWVQFQDEYDCIYSLADLHTLTVKQVPAELRARSYELLALYLACGLDPEKSIIFAQSHVPQHAELTWVLNTMTYPGELARMTQFKDKSAHHAENINMGLMDYPVLMASDILLYGAHYVPIGADQKQHLEITRDLAIRFNNRYSPTFVVPEPLIPKMGARVMSLQDPTKKMSKSDENVNAFISMTDKPEDIIRKFKRAVTDSDTCVKYDVENKPGVSNLLTIYSIFTGKTVEEAEREFEGKGYGEFKQAVGEAVVEVLRPINEKKEALLNDKAYLNKVLADGKQKAEYLARKMLNKVYKKIGLIQL